MFALCYAKLKNSLTRNSTSQFPRIVWKFHDKNRGICNIEAKRKGRPAKRKMFSHPSPQGRRGYQRAIEAGLHRPPTDNLGASRRGGGGMQQTAGQGHYCFFMPGFREQLHEVFEHEIGLALRRWNNIMYFLCCISK